MSGEHDVCPFCRDDMCNEACKDRRIAELEAKARTDAEGIAELQQIIESYNAFCKGAGAHVVLAEQDAEIKRLRAEVGRLRGAWKLAPAAEVGDDRKDEVAEYIDHEITKYRKFNNPSMMQLYDDALAMLNELDDYREAAIAASKEGKR